MLSLTEEIEDIIYRIIGCAIAVHTEFGPGLLESIYQECLVLELVKAELKVEAKTRVPLVYQGTRLSGHLELDLLVEDAVIVELKAVERLHPVYLAQVITYLKLASKPAGLLINFNTPSLRAAGIRRVTHPTLYTEK